LKFSSRISGIISELFGGSYPDKYIEIVWATPKEFHGYYTCTMKMYKDQRVLAVINFVIRKMLDVAKKEMESEIEKFLAKSIESNIISLTAFPKATQEYFYEKRGKFTGKRTGILESTNSTDFKDRIQNALERLGFQIEPSKRGNDIRRYTERFGKNDDLFFVIEFNNLRLNRRNMIVFERNKFEFQDKDPIRVIAIALREAMMKRTYFNPHYIDPKLVTPDELPRAALKEVENVRGEITGKNTGIS
jgi:hypothetical protein